jgi:hypothetical protein
MKKSDVSSYLAVVFAVLALFACDKTSDANAQMAMEISAPGESAAGHLLWYRQPAGNWNEALPVGNGRMGAMVFGDPDHERIQLNEDSVWAGEARDVKLSIGTPADLAHTDLIPQCRAPPGTGFLSEAQHFAGPDRGIAGL